MVGKRIVGGARREKSKVAGGEIDQSVDDGRLRAVEARGTEDVDNSGSEKRMEQVVGGHVGASGWGVACRGPVSRELSGPEKSAHCGGWLVAGELVSEVKQRASARSLGLARVSAKTLRSLAPLRHHGEPLPYPQSLPFPRRAGGTSGGASPLLISCAARP